jgi:hypothetical protein
MSRSRLVALVVICFILSTGAGWCGSSLPAFDPVEAASPIDYSLSESWLAVPQQEDRFAVDVFWVYPTVFSGDSGWLMNISDQEMRNRAQATLARQASVFSCQANLYAPMYRQMNMAGLSLTTNQRESLMEYGRADLANALDYYLKNQNKGRPFILAGHSQGAELLLEWALKHWGSTGVEDGLVAAYVIGWSITKDDLTRNEAVRVCRRSGETGCFVSYNSVAPGHLKDAPTIRPGAVVVNPLSWTTDEALVPATSNLGSAFFAADGTTQTIPGFASAQVEGDGLVVVASDPALLQTGSSTFPTGVYHPFDYGLFFENLRSNSAERIQSYLIAH